MSDRCACVSWDAEMCLIHRIGLELTAAALEVVDEYFSHTGRGTHTECDPACCCQLGHAVNALAKVLGR